jgi:hypothetical protein
MSEEYGHAELITQFVKVIPPNYISTGKKCGGVKARTERQHVTTHSSYEKPQDKLSF